MVKAIVGERCGNAWYAGELETIRVAVGDADLPVRKTVAVCPLAADAGTASGVAR